jgi:hypothetical protein
MGTGKGAAGWTGKQRDGEDSQDHQNGKTLHRESS